MFRATITIDRRDLPDLKDNLHGTDHLAIRIMEAIGKAASTFEMVLNPAEAIALGEKIAPKNLSEDTIVRMTKEFGGTVAESWTASQRAAAYLVQTVLSRCPRLVELIDREDGEHSGDLIVKASDAYGVSFEIGWPENLNPCRGSTVTI